VHDNYIINPKTRESYLKKHTAACYQYVMKRHRGLFRKAVMDDFSEIITAEYGDEQDRARTYLHGWYSLLGFIESQSRTAEQRAAALGIIQTMRKLLDITAETLEENNTDS
jgi:hypothetical protein